MYQALFLALDIYKWKKIPNKHGTRFLVVGYKQKATDIMLNKLYIMLERNTLWQTKSKVRICTFISLILFSLLIHLY